MLKSQETWLSLLPEKMAEDRTALAIKSSGGVSLPPAPAERAGSGNLNTRVKWFFSPLTAI